MKKYKLDKEEQEILDAFESGKLESNMTSHRKKFIKDSAAQTFKKDKRINITMDWTGPTSNSRMVRPQILII